MPQSRYRLRAGLLHPSPLDSLATMRRPRRPKDQRPPAGFLLAPKSGFRHYRWVVLLLAVVLVVAFILVLDRLGVTSHPLPPIGSVIVTVSVLAAALAGVIVGLVVALTGVLAALLLLADFSTTAGSVNALISAVVWCGAAVGTGLIGRHLRRQVRSREAGLQEALSRSLTAKNTLEQVLDLSPRLLTGATLVEVARTACESACSTFGADGARVFRLKDSTMELLALCPNSKKIKPGFEILATDFPDLEIMMARRRPLFVRDVGETRPTGPADHLRQELGIVSSVRLPIVGPSGPEGVLSLGWQHTVDRPAEDTLVVMQRFADQVAIAWHNALRLEAQRRANRLRRTLDRVLRLAPTFHMSSSREVVAKAICRAALSTFGCSGAALYLVEGDRLLLLERLPRLDSMPPGRAFPLTSAMPLAHEIRAPRATFIADVSEPSRTVRPWPQEVVKQAGTRSALYVPLHFDERGPANLLVLTWKTPRKTPDDSFLAVTQRFTDQAALALAHSSTERLHARLEASLLPTAPIEHPRLQVITRYQTGEQRLRLGGDFLGSTVSDDSVLSFAIGDVSGHGPDAAALGATLRSTWKALTLAGEGLAKTADVMARLIMGERSTPNAFATIVIGRIDTERRLLQWINAGHLPPLLIADRVTVLDSRPIPPLGVGKNLPHAVHRTRLPERWSLFCYTDGLVDVRVSPGALQRYGEERLQHRLADWIGTTPDGDALDAVLTDIESASGSRFADDMAVLLICTKDGPQANAPA